ncbi:MAG: FAD-dependent oxidoreductase, partial [Bacteroidales bacterium]|nr:FAD-dependent oxidoreductase [Bacteroidales bacterium]
MHNEHFDAIVLGAGPAGLTAAIYLSRARIKTLVLNQGTVGGQMILTHEVANYPGVEHVSGYALANIMKKQAKEFGAVLKTVRTIDDIALLADKKTVSVNGDTVYTADVVILTPGGRSRTLGVPGENRFKGHGISYCA